MTTNKPARREVGLAGMGAAACVACCAGPIIGFLTAASIATLVGVALFGIAGLAVAVVAAVAYVHRRRIAATTAEPGPMPVTLGKKPDA